MADLSGIVVLGVDLSLTGLGLVAVPANWDLRWERVQSISLGMNLPKGASRLDYVRRRRALALDLVEWATRRNVTHLWFEAYPMGSRLFNIDKLAELGGVVQDWLADAGYVIDPVPETTGRKLLLGKLPPRDRKAVVFNALIKAGARFDDADQSDAFTVANYGLAQLGAPFVTFNFKDVEMPQTKRRRRTA